MLDTHVQLLVVWSSHSMYTLYLIKIYFLWQMYIRSRVLHPISSCGKYSVVLFILLSFFCSSISKTKQKKQSNNKGSLYSSTYNHIWHHTRIMNSTLTYLVCLCLLKRLVGKYRLTKQTYQGTPLTTVWCDMKILDQTCWCRTISIVSLMSHN